MKKQIWKFEINPADRSIEMPIGAEILTVQMQGSQPVLWALIDPIAPVEDRYFEIYGTGHDIDYDMGIQRKYINTFQTGPFVFHVFERIDGL